MCNIAGYIGNDRAAPILLGMMKHQQGFAGGHYSGIATLHNGKIHHAKVVGDFATLCQETDAETLPGTIGIAHSRPALGGDVAWAHPFLNSAETYALVVNGHPGFFEDTQNERNIMNRLEQAGQCFRSASQQTPDAHSSYPSLADGRTIHASELRCHYVASLMDQGADHLSAMSRGFATYPAEVVGLSLSVTTPQQIVAARFNQPLMIGFAPEAVYMATTALAFASEQADNVFPMPISAAALIGMKSMQTVPFAPAGRIACVFPYAAGCAAIMDALDTGTGRTIQDLKNATRHLWPEDRAPQKDMMVYEILRSLHAENLIRFVDGQIAGPDGKPAALTMIHLEQ